MSDPVATTREALAGIDAWIVGGTVRDRLLERPTVDLDLVVDGDVGAAARRLARAARGPAFELSDEFGAWRVMAGDRAWHADLSPLRGGSLEADLALRDFTVNAIAQPLDGGELVDPHGGAADLAARRLRAVGPRTFADDPLRAVRLVRLAAELEFEVESTTSELARMQAARVAQVAQERVFAELKRIFAADGVTGSLRRMDALGLTAAILPEFAALQGVEQNRYHHADVHDHTIEVLERTLALHADPGAVFDERHAQAVRDLLAEPLADDVDRGVALHLGALLHDAAKPATLGHRDDGIPDVPRPRPRGRTARPRRPHAAARERAAEGARVRARAPPPAPGLPRPRAPAVAARAVSLPDDLPAGRGRRHAAVGRRPACDARAQG